MTVQQLNKKISIEFTYDDLESWDREEDHLEIFDGELIVSPPPNVQHQNVVGNLYRIISNYIYDEKIGKVLPSPIGIYFDFKTFFEPDIVFVSAKNLGKLKEKYIQGAPDLVIEVISPSSAKRDRGYKFKRYAQEGVEEYWIVDPINEIVEIYNLTSGSFQLSGRFLQNDSIRSQILCKIEFNLLQIWE